MGLLKVQETPADRGVSGVVLLPPRQLSCDPIPKRIWIERPTLHLTQPSLPRKVVFRCTTTTNHCHHNNQPTIRPAVAVFKVSFPNRFPRLVMIPSGTESKSDAMGLESIRSSFTSSFGSFFSPIGQQHRNHDEEGKEAEELESGNIMSTSFLIPKSISGGANSASSSVSDLFGSPLKKVKEASSSVSDVFGSTFKRTKEEPDSLDCGLTRATRFKYFIGLLVRFSLEHLLTSLSLLLLLL
jgi:hypothetical protein